MNLLIRMGNADGASLRFGDPAGRNQRSVDASFAGNYEPGFCSGAPITVATHFLQPEAFFRRAEFGPISNPQISISPLFSS